MQRQKAEAKGEQLVHLFRLVEQTMALSELVTFPGLFRCSSGGLGVVVWLGGRPELLI